MASSAIAWLFLSCCLAAVAIGCGRAGDPSVDIRLAREANGRVVAYGHAKVPDGNWIYVEVVADPDRLRGVFSEAFPVISGVFAAPTPFSEPLVYKATAVLSPLLNPDLTAVLNAIPERRGAVMRAAAGAKELIAECRSEFGTEEERDKAARGIVDEAADARTRLRSRLESFARADMAGNPKELFGGELLGPRVGVYSAILGDGIRRAGRKLDDLARLRFLAATGQAATADTMDKAVLAATREMDRLDKALSNPAFGK